ncbi:hypothetical protein C0991_004671 [Blastosporella zonata]|nr:hypothetical protein C0991_004671 [Blastosporella zonata]
MASSERRTRSQLTIPDDLLLQLSQGSPLKDARTALRQNAEIARHFDEEMVEETDDELLLSPGKPIKTMRTTKRSVSPPPGDEYTFRPNSPSNGRELKRTKLDADVVPPLHDNTTRPRSAHTRSLSQPEPGRSTTHNRSETASGLGPQFPSQSKVDEPTATGKGRAQSVPLFSIAGPAEIMRIDLRNPPASPCRPRSRSPSKERELRIVPGPVITRLDTIPDEAESAMNVDEDTETSPQEPVALEADSMSISKGTSPKIIPEEPMPSRKEPPPLVLPVIIEPPATPAQGGHYSPLSPLTPIPDTPLPLKVVKQDIRYNGSGWGANIEEEEGETSVLPPPPAKPLPSLATTMKSRLPRPSSSTNLSTLATDPPPEASTAKKPVVSNSSELAATVSKPSNAFAVLMASARGGNGKEPPKGKGKGKEKAVAKPGPSSGAPSKSASSSSKPLQKGKAKDVPPPPKPSLKSKMKPKTTPKTKVKPASLNAPSPSPEDEKEPNPPPTSSLPRSPSPDRSTHPARPTTPLIMDVSMEIIKSTVDGDVPMNLTPETPAPLNPPGSNTIESIATVQAPTVEPLEPVPLTVPASLPETKDSDKVEPPREAAVDDAATVLPADAVLPISAKLDIVATSPTVTSSIEPTSVEPPTTKPKTTKLHISKRIPTTVAPARITRSASLRRNKVSEVLKALPTRSKAVGKQIAPEPEVVASGSSNKLADEAPVDTAPSTSTEPDATTLPSGSPMKVSSPTKRTIRTPRGSFAQPTKSAMAKQVSPTKPSLPKSRTSSPNKLGRSSSMTSRPRVSMSRSFTHSRLEGSSLSTLSSALEKLQQRPPGRPNTSMGFNRDDPDSSIELETKSNDDCSIGPPGSSGSKPVSSASQAAAGSSRLVQGTLTGPLSSLTGKFTGSKTLMRGTGVFKVPGLPTKPGTRIFGVGGGAFAGATRARTMQKASRKTSLPSVMASPVKGGGNDDAMDVTDDDNPLPGAQQDKMAAPADASADHQVSLNDKGKGKERATEPWISDASRRVSLASQALSQSLASSAKGFTGLGSMGPPVTTKGRKVGRSASSTYPSTSFPESPSRSSLRLVQAASNTGSSGSKAASAASAASHPESLKVLKDCVIFVDVRNDDGDEVGSLFVEMLEGMGARILTRVGQTCTHIVFKNGLMSTINRYRLLRDPKPLVVGIAWVVECVEQRMKVDETKFLVDLDSINFSGPSKRRRSMLPKLISHDFEERQSSDVEGDVSMDGSTSSMTQDDNLTPLEKARRRKTAAR